MSVIDALRSGWYATWRHKKLWLLWYVCSLALALIALAPLRSWLKSAAGHSVEVSAGSGRFDFTFYSDLVRNYGTLSPYISNILLISACYIFLTVLLSAATLHVYTHHHEKVTIREWIDGGLRHFWAMLRLALCFIAIHIILIAISIAILITIGINPMTIENDAMVLKDLTTVVSMYIVLVLFVMIFHLFAKIDLVRNGHARVFRAISVGARFAIEHFWKVLLICALGAGLFIVLMVVRRHLSAILSDVSVLSLALLFAAGQLYMFGRIGVRLLILASGVELMKLVGGEGMEPARGRPTFD